MTSALVSPSAAFGYRDFRLFQAGRFLSTLAVQMQSVAVGWQVYELTGRALSLGIVGLVQFVPIAGLSLFAGQTADRFDRRRISIACYVSLTACSLLLRWQAGHAVPGRAWPIYAALVLFGATRAFIGPSNQALLPSLVPNELFSSAVAWGSSVWQIAAITGPALGGWLYGFAGGSSLGHGAATVYLTCALLFAGAAGFLSAMEVRTGRMEAHDVSLATVLAGVRYVWREKAVLGSISMDLFAVLFGGATALLPMFAHDILRVGPGGLGLLRSAPAAGAAVIAVAMAFAPLRRHEGVVMFACVAIFGIATVVFGLSRNFTLSMAALFVVGASDMVSVVVRQTLVQLWTPAAMRGRVSAVNLIFVGASNELGELESGLTAAWFGSAVASVVFGGVAACVVVALWTVFFPGLRNADQLARGPDATR